MVSFTPNSRLEDAYILHFILYLNELLLEKKLELSERVCINCLIIWTNISNEYLLNILYVYPDRSTGGKNSLENVKNLEWNCSEIMITILSKMLQGLCIQII